MSMKEIIKEAVEKAINGTGLVISKFNYEVFNDDSDLVTVRVTNKQLEDRTVPKEEEQATAFYEQLERDCIEFAKVFKEHLTQYYQELHKEFWENQEYAPYDLRIIWTESSRHSLIGIQNNMNLIITVQNTDYGFTITVTSNAE